MARKRSKQTQAELARRVGLSRTSITNIECGRQAITLPVLVELALALDIEPAALVPTRKQGAFLARRLENLRGLNEEDRQWMHRVLATAAGAEEGRDA
jgi:transcriptional regulator with XRE-family HTH domain